MEKNSNGQNLADEKTTVQNNNDKNGHLPKTARKFLFVSWESLSGDLAWQIQKEGHEVKIFIKEKTDVYDGFLEKVDSWKAWIDWADVVVFDDIWFGEEADKLRKAGKAVVGGSVYTDRLEDNREFGQSEMKRVGIPVLPNWNFDNYETALKFIQDNPGRYVYKPYSDVHSDLRGLLFTGREEDGKDIYEMISSNKLALEKKIKKFQLQKFISGVEIGASAFFNGEDFVYPILINFEHKRLFPGDIGPFTGEMGTSMFWSEPNYLFRATLEKMRESLRESNYAGYIDINCIVNGKGIYPLEFTCFSEDTEILTQEGWKLVKNIQPNEKIATLNPKSHYLEYQSLSGFISKKYNGNLIHIGGSGTTHQALDCLVTPDHQMYVQKRNGKFDFVNADSIPQGSKIKRDAKWQGKNIPTYLIPVYIEKQYLEKYHKIHKVKHPEIRMPMNTWLKFLGIYLAEGSIGSKGRIVGISQYIREGEVKKLLSNFPFKIVEHNKGFQINSVQLANHLISYEFGESNTKYVPDYVKTLPSKQIKIFLEAFRVGDGAIHKRTGQISYFSTSRKLIDDIQELLLKCGIVGNIRKVNSKNTKSIGGYIRNHDIYFINERSQKKNYYVDKRNIKTLPYSGRVYCVEVPNHIIYMRRNGKAFWAGNCRFGYPTISIQMEGVLNEWGEFLYALASRQPYKLKTKKGFQIGIVCALPPFPYEDRSEAELYKDLSILFKKPDLEGIHLGDVKMIDNIWRVAGKSGYALVVTGSGATMNDARRQAYNKIDNIILQNMFYRTDIGATWSEDSDKLRTWGYL